MIEAGWEAIDLLALAPTKLVWIHRQRQRRQIECEMRGLLNSVAAANTGANGGDAAKARFRALETELQALGKTIGGNPQTPMAPQSQMPGSAAEFAAMMEKQKL